MTIHFGTSGWRAIVAEEFTYANVRLATKAVCDYLHLSDANKSSHERVNSKQSIVIGHDTRFGGEEFAGEAIEIVTNSGFDVLACT
ncbi:MAG: phosphoglucomutase/phosphomannomutase family protein, partial [Pyrinomonadaceae bacterium]